MFHICNNSKWSNDIEQFLELLLLSLWFFFYFFAASFFPDWNSFDFMINSNIFDVYEIVVSCLPQIPKRNFSFHRNSELLLCVACAQISKVLLAQYNEEKKQIVGREFVFASQRKASEKERMKQTNSQTCDNINIQSVGWLIDLFIFFLFTDWIINIDWPHIKTLISI